MMQSIYDLSFSEVTTLMTEWHQPHYRLRQIWEGIYRTFWESYDQATTLPKELRQALSERFPLRTITPLKQITSKDGQTIKILFRLHDGMAIEAVLMRYQRRRTLCISTQVGCAIGCSFCATGQMGFKRNLSPGEIIQQIVFFAHHLAEEQQTVSNVVFMGMGEPFHNYQATTVALDRLEDPLGMALSPRRFTISTVGVIPGIQRFTQERRRENLAVSLHSIDPRQREDLIPIARKYSLDELKSSCLEYVRATKRRLSFEWALMEHLNDHEDQAEALAIWLKDFFIDSSCLCHVNLIPLNPTAGFRQNASPRKKVQRFQEVLQMHHIPCTVRLRRGIEINAGCGQLAAAN